MRKKLWIGVSVIAVLVAAAGFFGRTLAQDNPKKAEPEQKKSDVDLFEVLKQALEGKKEPLPPIPPAVNSTPIPVIPPPASGVKVDDKSLPSFPAVPPLKDVDKPKPADVTIPPPVSLPTPKDLEKPKPADVTIPPPVVDKKPVDPLDFGGPRSIGDGVRPLPPPVNTDPPTIPPVNNNVKPPVPSNFEPVPGNKQPELPPAVKPMSPPPPTVHLAPAPAIADQVAKIKDCPWSLHIDIIDGQTIVTATVHKKHEFKLVCQSLDLQTGKHTLKATGKVRITGDMMTGHCDSLSIPLLEDRLMMEGSAHVMIERVSAKVSDGSHSNFVLKGATLDLHISDIIVSRDIRQTSGLVEKSPVRANVEPTTLPPTPGAKDSSGKQWSEYGTLRRVEMKLYPGNESAMWELHDRGGKVIATVLAREGGSLSQFEGQRISLLGANVRIDGQTYLRVTHVALP